MSGVQGIIVCGEASESDEEEEFCAATARGHKSLTLKSGGSTETKGQHKPPEPKHTQKQRPQQQQRKGHQSLLHQKLWEANASMEKNISKSICGPLTTETNRISRLIASLPAAQNSTLTAHSALSHAARNLSNSHFLLAALNNNPLACLKSP
ncbi:uncharacterized protein LOC122256418 [Penaeus japonicus]|uniref:uncharacterized protein LOC122256418 n=1 Tax=Penaeus japonicus TaxID=27405 RepID=UPI001C7114D4|nr:uncharacterized protein LOC122256418 [Penaeus japonicus]XP_042877011.1 uncharacterized protein LOC122256418 [Penaeus japonicus]